MIILLYCMFYNGICLLNNILFDVLPIAHTHRHRLFFYHVKICMYAYAV